MFGFIKYFFSNRRGVYTIRRNYDKIREDVVKKEESQEKIIILRMLDQVEPNIATLEEQNLSGSDKRKLKLLIRTSLERIKMRMKPRKKTKNINKYRRR